MKGEDRPPDRFPSPAAWAVFLLSLVVLLVSLIYVLVPFDQEIPISPQRRLHAECGSSVGASLTDLPSEAVSGHDRFRVVECRSEARFRLLKASVSSSISWFIGAIALLRSKRKLRTWQRILFQGIGLGFAVGASLAALGFGLATSRNPYNDVTFGYTFIFTILSTGAAIIFWILFGLLKSRLPRAPASAAPASS